MTQDTLAFAHQQVASGSVVALVTITNISGSSPASVGQMIAVSADGATCGTVGGGATEYRIIERATEAIGHNERAFTFQFDHSEAGMICGGSLEGYGTVLGNDNHLYIFGGGHVGQALTKLALATGFAVTVIDDRPEMEAHCPDARFICAKPTDYATQVSFHGAPYVVICSWGHLGDEQALRFALQQDTRYVGMIGSRNKVTATYKRLLGDGFTQSQLDGVYAPIGLNIASSAPAEIAVSILAEILLVKNHGKPDHRRI